MSDAFIPVDIAISPQNGILIAYDDPRLDAVKSIVYDKNLYATFPSGYEAPLGILPDRYRRHFEDFRKVYFVRALPTGNLGHEIPLRAR